MNEKDKAELINSDRLKQVSMGQYLGMTVILERLLTRVERDDRYSKLFGEHAWWVRFPDQPSNLHVTGRFYVPISCLRVITHVFNKRDSVSLINREKLAESGLADYYGFNGELVSRLSGGGEETWEVNIYGIGHYWVPVSCLRSNKPTTQPSTSPSMEAGEPNQNQNQKEKLNMYVYKVRFMSIPSVLAQQAGEKETIVATVDDILASHEHAAVAEAAADNAEAIQKVRASKGTLSVTVKTS